MTQPIVCLGHTSDHGGSMVTASTRFKSRGKVVCIDGDMHDCPIPGHGTTAVHSSSKTRSNGKGIIRVGDRAECGATITEGSVNVNSN